MTIRIAALVLLFAAPNAAQGVPGQISFSQTAYLFPTKPFLPNLFHIGVADVDGDSDLDVVTSHLDTLATYLGAGDGTFGAPVVTPTPGIGAYRLAVGELDGDGCADVLAMWIYAHVLPSQCDGSFTMTGPTLPMPTAESCNEGLIADVNGDGRNDAVVNTYELGIGSLNVHLGTDFGAFTWVQSDFAGDLSAVVGGHLDGDPYEDVIAIGTASSIRYGQASGQLCCKFELHPFGYFTAVVIADVDDDGRNDLVASKYTLSGVVSLATYPKASFGDFGSVVESPIPIYGAGGGMLLAGDFDLDGRLDVGGRHGPTGSPSIALARGRGDGAFELAYSAGVPGQANASATGDFDGDGRLDIAVTHSKAARVSILLNTTVPSSWVDLGQALAGAGGKPLLSGTGSLTGGTATTLDLIHAAPSSPSVLVAGGTQIALPILGGVLVPSPEVLVFGLTTSAQGTLAHSFAWPGGIPSGAAIYFQAWTADAAAVQGSSASNGLAATVP